MYRFNTVTKDNIENWFKNFYQKLPHEDYDPKLIANMDEVMVDFKRKIKLVTLKTIKQVIGIQDEESEHITSALCIFANGDYMPPYMIFPLDNLPKELAEMIKENKFFIGGQKSGWMTSDTFLCWFKKFLEIIQQRRILYNLQNKKALLLTDNHNSRFNLEVS